MSRYRYRTRALVGQWRETAEEAADDAVRAGQAIRVATDASELRWRIMGRIEQEGDHNERGDQ